jgi:hypothetical protein
VEEVSRPEKVTKDITKTQKKQTMDSGEEMAMQTSGSHIWSYGKRNQAQEDSMEIWRREE